jgi:diguanylate cyclase (GGDEF)-like protein
MAGTRQTPRRRDAISYLLAVVAAFATIPLPPNSGANEGHVAAAAVVVLGASIVAWMSITRSFGSWMSAMPAYVFLIAVALLRDAEGVATSGFGVLVLLTLTWLALHGDRPQLFVGIAGMSVMFAAPILLAGAPEYPATEWRRTVLWMIVGTITAMTIQRLVQRERTHAVDATKQSMTDPLTGLPNRRELTRVLELEIERAHSLGTPLTVAMVDVDHFKRYNDTRGHAAGDELLVGAATAWRQLVRRGDLVARYGGEEFTVVLPSCDSAQANVLLDRIRRATPDDQTCSIGVATWDGSESGTALVERADSGLYEAKRAGRDRVVSV